MTLVALLLLLAPVDESTEELAGRLAQHIPRLQESHDVPAVALALIESGQGV